MKEREEDLSGRRSAFVDGKASCSGNDTIPEGIGRLGTSPPESRAERPLGTRRVGAAIRTALPRTPNGPHSPAEEDRSGRPGTSASQNRSHSDHSPDRVAWGQGQTGRWVPQNREFMVDRFPRQVPGPRRGRVDFPHVSNWTYTRKSEAGPRRHTVCKNEPTVAQRRTRESRVTRRQQTHVLVPPSGQPAASGTTAGHKQQERGRITGPPRNENLWGFKGRPRHGEKTDQRIG